MFWKYHLLYSAPTSKNGVALFVHTSISPIPPALTVHIPGILISTQLHLHPDPLIPPLRIASYYGPHTMTEKRRCEPVLNSLLREACIILGDYNCTTHHSHATTLTSNLWPWLIAKERSGALSDLLLPFTTSTPYTRVRRYAGTKSYIDRAYGTRLYQACYSPSSAEVVDFSKVHGSSDHDPIIIRSIPWTTPQIPEPRCAQWNRRDLHKFRSLMEHSVHDLQTPTSFHDVESTYHTLVQHMLHAMRTVNSAKPALQTNSTDISDWHQVVKQLTRQAKRRSKVFYRRIKHTLLTPPAPSTLPVPSRKIQRILQRNSPWSARASELITPQPLLPDPPPPSVEELRILAKSSRKKSPGPDGVPPYLIAVLPDAAFSIVHQCLTLCYDVGDIPHSWLVSETLCIFKGKGSWRDPDRWRPIAMSNSVYRLLMRWIYKKLYPLLSPQLHPRQFGGRRGVSTAHATQTFFDDIDNGTSWESIFTFDMYHAFDSPPKILIRDVLQRMGTPTKLLLLISTVLEHGSTYIRGTPDEIFGTTHGVKQGCPISCFLFVIVFEIPLRYIHSHNILFSAYVDDISTPVAHTDGPRVASIVQTGLNLIGCQLNVIKSESLPVSPHCTPPPMLPKYSHPPSPLQVSADFWVPESCSTWPDWADSTEYPMAKVSHLMHLGHPIPKNFDVSHAFQLIFRELQAQLAELNALPSQSLDRILVANTLILPRLLYRCECLPLSADQLNPIIQAIERYVLGVAGLPSLLAKKTLYTHHTHGLGLRYFAVVQPTRILDSLHTNPHLFHLSTQSIFPLSPWRLFATAIALLGPPRASPMIPLPVSWGAKRALRGASTVITESGITAYILPGPNPPPDCTYTDGSRLGTPPASGACALLPDGRIVVCRVPGPPNSYKAEVIGILLGSEFPPPSSKIKVDCKGAISSTTGERRPLRYAHYVQLARKSIQSKCHAVEWIEGHTGHLFQERSDEFAKYGSTLPLPPAAKPSSPWDVVRHGELMSPPHKVWTHDLFPTHTHENFHSSSWRPLKFRRLAWHKWLFGLQTRLGYSHYATFWKDDVPPTPCPHCSLRHNMSVHGYIAHCSPAHPLVHAWTTAWPVSSTPIRWRATAHKRDLRITGRLAIPISLFRALSAAHGGPRAARKIVYKWQESVMDKVTGALSDYIPAPSSKPNPFTPSDWNVTSRPV